MLPPNARNTGTDFAISLVRNNGAFFMNGLAQSLNAYTYYLKTIDTDITTLLRRIPDHINVTGLFFGNQRGKTFEIAKHYFERVLGLHKSDRRNRLAKKIRCISSSLPENSNADEQDNTQYLVVKRPVGMSSKPTIFEFRSSKQELQDLGKIQLSSLWHDEETPKPIREECQVRLLAEDGDEFFSLTPVNAMTYTYDDVWKRAEYIYRSKTVAEKFNLPRQEKPNENKNSGIWAFQSATDDNPILDKNIIERIFRDITDPDEIALRRYGVFKQVSGRIHKTYDPKYCYISYDKHFPQGIPDEWMHCRGIDYHESRTPWSIGWVSISPQNEWFLWHEFHPAIDGAHAYNTHEIVKAMARKSEDYDYRVNLIDPLANKKQANSGFSTTEDINRYFKALRQDEGLGRKCFWEGWDTKGTTGRDAISKRFKNAVQCGVPFNNAYKERGKTSYLPTLWVCDTCPKFHRSILDWRFSEYVTTTTKAVNDPKNYPMQKNSHDNMVLECLAKNYLVQTACRYLNREPYRQPIRTYSVTGRC